VSYPISISHTETLTVKVYTFECSAESETYVYRVGDEAISIIFTVNQAPDTEVIREFEVFAVNKSDGSKLVNPSFVTLSNSLKE